MVLVDGSQAEGSDGQVNKAVIGEDHCAVFIALDQELKGDIVDMGRIPLPIDHLAEMIEQETQFGLRVFRPIHIAHHHQFGKTVR
jgi:hypothetical protein